MSDYTNEPWTNGYGEGVTGPTSPSTDGVTVSEQIQRKVWRQTGLKEDYPYEYYTVISKDKQTIAIVPTLPHMKEEGLANARRITECVNAMEGIENPEEFVRKAKELKMIEAYRNVSG